MSPHAPVATGTVAAELAWAADALLHAGLADPAREAASLWAALAGTTVGAVWLARRDPVPSEAAAAFRAAVGRRAAGEPAAYATGRAAFRTLDLQVDRRVLIPRPETEGLVEWCLRIAVEGSGIGDRGSGAVLDIGTGSGCIALALAVEGTFDRVVATDVSADALAVARANHAAAAPATPVEFRLGSLFEPLAPDERFALIVSNPPYVTAAEHAALDPAVRDHEPAGALVSGADGLRHLDALLAGAARHLAPGGRLCLEVDSTRAGATRARARELGWSNARVERDLFGRPRYLLATTEIS